MEFITYKKCIDYLFSLERVGIKYDLNNIKYLMRHLNNPHKKFLSIHIAGTNGKGSVASMLNSVFIESGYKTGLYTSPHILDFRERIRVNGTKIPPRFIIDFVNKNYEIIEKIKPSFFEITTALAFDYFAYKNIDIAIIETGMGGRLDSTNILKPLVSVITSISKDHSEYLGNTIREITYEKAGIIKHKIPCVIGELPNLSVKIISEKCKELKSDLIVSKNFKLNIKTINESGITFNCKLNNKDIQNINLPIIGKYQIKNIRTALSVLDLLKTKFRISRKSIIDGFDKIKIHSGFGYRFQQVSKTPNIFVDVSHNLEAIKNLKENLGILKYKNLIIIFGMMADKDYKDCLKLIESLNPFIIATQPDYKRALPAEKIFEVVKNKNKVIVTSKVKDAKEFAIKKYKNGDLILVIGSFFLVNEFLKYNK